MAWLKLGAMLGVFALSLLASTFPTLSKRLTFIDLPHTLFFVLKHFGTGVILSTAFVHLLQDAFKVLLGLPEGNPIRHWVGLIVLAALLAIFLMEYLSMAYVEHLEKNCKSIHDEEHGHHHHHEHQYGDGHTLDSEASEVTPKPCSNGGILMPLPEDSDSIDGCKANLRSTQTDPVSERTSLLRTTSSPTGAVPTDGHHHYASTCESSKDGCAYKNKFEFLRRKLHRHREDLYASHGRCESGSAACLREEEDDDDGLSHLVHDDSSVGRKHAIVNTLVLQAGIMIHSMVIGLTLSIKSGPEFTSLVIAILFHQLFEGLSLGVRLAGLAPSSPSQHDKTLSLPIILAIIFALAVPVGCLIGHLTLDSNSTSSSPDDLRLPLAQGLTSAVSAGTLIYASGVELLAGDFLHSSLRQSSMARQALALVSLLAGAAGMAALAAFD